MYLMNFELFNTYFDRFSQYLVMYLVTGLKGLPGGEIWFVTRPGPPGVIIMECRVLDLAVPVCLQRTSWSVAPERLEVSRDPPAKWLNATY